MASRQWRLAVVLLSALLLLRFCSAADPIRQFNWQVSYITASPLGVPQQVIAINGQFPGPVLQVTTNWNAVVNVTNNLDEDLLFTWNGIQLRRNSWQDGVLGTNCPIPKGENWTYDFQVKDQIGSFYYFPSLNLQRAAGGYGGIIVDNRSVVPLPFPLPDGGDITVFIGDWFNKNHRDLKQQLDQGNELGIPDGVLINGKGPYRYNNTVLPSGIEYETINVEPGKTYRFRVHNVGSFTSLNFRIQSHSLLLVETEGSYTVQQNYTDFDIHVGQSYSFLITMDQNSSNDYYIVASSRFMNGSLWSRVTGVAVLHYSSSKNKPIGPLPDPPNDLFFKEYSMNQARSIRWNLSASAARPNPQGSFKIGSINISETYVLRNKAPISINGKLRATINDVSYISPDTPLRLADNFANITGVYKLDFPVKPFPGAPRIAASVINSTYKDFVEIVFQNNDSIVQTYHMDGYSFFVVGFAYGEWTEACRNSYNKWDAVARSTIQVYPGAWTAILVMLDNVGIWNLRAGSLERWYLGQETYLRIVNPEPNNRTELPIPSNALYCGKAYWPKNVTDHGSGSSLLPSHLCSVMAILLVLTSYLLMYRTLRRLHPAGLNAWWRSGREIRPSEAVAWDFGRFRLYLVEEGNAYCYVELECFGWKWDPATEIS
ncbi:monocopper oxidase-like protein SKU5 [Dendrobium catenatum]|uniref:monocopper oxidase-like protein SKU5 n=1 Tax=Dendrobium catenatum TaxID=906689 RepID=UPI0010A05D5A|nr:monocopper oxidase-like protein SKU5 [Dendrobium catenatum]